MPSMLDFGSRWGLPSHAASVLYDTLGFLCKPLTAELAGLPSSRSHGVNPRRHLLGRRRGIV
jgi:hypothetical protein